MQNLSSFAKFISLIALMIAFINVQNISAQNATTPQDNANSQDIQRQIQQNANATQGIDSKEVEALYIQRAQKSRARRASTNFVRKIKKSLKPSCVMRECIWAILIQALSPI